MTMIQRFSTLRFRFALWTATFLITALIGFGVFVYVIMSSELARSVDDALQLSAAQAIAATVEDGYLSVSDGLPELSTVPSLQDKGLTIRVLNADGVTLGALGAYRDLPVTISNPSEGGEGNVSFVTLMDTDDAEPVRFYTAPILSDNRLLGYVQVGQSLDLMNDTLERLLTALLISIPLLVGLASVGSYVLVTRTLTPIDSITHTAERISAQDLHERLNFPNTHDEVGRLAATFDTMLDRLERSFLRERQFTADASHELRTPLTAMQTIIAVTRERRRTPEAYEQVLDDFNSETKRLRQMVEDLLQLARGDQGADIAPKLMNLTLLLRDVADVFAPLLESKQLRLELDVPDNLLIIGDSDNLVRLFINLLDNAVKFTDEGEIGIRACAAVRSVSIAISDTGVGIAEGDLAQIFDRFYRIDSSRSTSGNGLGLSIAKSIVIAHHGQIEVSSCRGHGSVFTIILPMG